MSVSKTQRQTDSREMAIDTLLWVIVGTTITLLGMALGALVLMNQGQINERLGMAFVLLTFVSLVVSDGLLVTRFLRLSRVAERKRAGSHANELSPEEPTPVTARALHEPLEPVSSVTEQTTPAFEENYRP